MMSGGAESHLRVCVCVYVCMCVVTCHVSGFFKFKLPLSCDNQPLKGVNKATETHLK